MDKWSLMQNSEGQYFLWLSNGSKEDKDLCLNFEITESRAREIIEETKCEVDKIPF